MDYYRFLPITTLSLALLAPTCADAANKSNSDIAKLAKAAEDAAQAAAAAAKAAAVAAEAANKAVTALQAASAPKKEESKPLTPEQLKEKAKAETIAENQGKNFFTPSAQDSPEKNPSASWIYISSLPLDPDHSKFMQDPPLRFYHRDQFTPIPAFEKPTFKNQSIGFTKSGRPPEMKLFEPGREIWEKGHEIRIGYIVPGDCKDIPEFVAFNEEQRSTLLQNQAKQLASSLIKADKSTTNTDEDRYCIYGDGYTLQEKRANLKLDVKGTGADERKTKSATIITGPEEHWYLSTEARLNSLKELTYDKATKSITEKKKSGNMYLGLNYMVGDILTDHGLTSLKNFGVKLMVNAHDKPLDSIGLGVSYQLKSNVLGTNLPVSYAVFGGYFRQKGQNGAASSGAWAWGLSYNFVSGENPKETEAKDSAAKK